MKRILLTGSLLFCVGLHAKAITILVLPFENTGMQSFSWISAGLSANLISDLLKINEVEVISAQERRRAQKELPSGLKVDDQVIRLGSGLGADFVFTGSYVVVKGVIGVDAKVLNVRTGQIGRPLIFDDVMPRYFEMQRRLFLELLAETEKNSNLRIAESEKDTIPSHSNPTLDAFELYAKGISTEDSNHLQALEFLKESLRLQPDYVDALIEAGKLAGYSLNEDPLEYLTTAKKILIDRNRSGTKDYANLMTLIGIHYTEKDQLDEALASFILSRKTYEALAIRNTISYATLLERMGILYGRLRQFDQAFIHFNLSRQIMDELGMENTAGYGNLLFNIAFLFQKKGDDQNAGKYYRRASDCYRIAGYQTAAKDAQKKAERLGQ